MSRLPGVHSDVPETFPPISETWLPCPHLPARPAQMDWRDLHAYREGDRGAGFYVACLRYAQFQWCRKLPARAILCLDRAFGAALAGDEAALVEWPLPYDAMAWLIHSTPEGVFIGNPRVHFQHYADRMNPPRRTQRQARAWACWAITRSVRPNLPADPRHLVREPAHEEIAAMLEQHGLPGEARLWSDVLQRWQRPAR